MSMKSYTPLRTTGGTGLNINPARKLNILVAEDDELNRILLCEILEKYGCAFKAAENGKVFAIKTGLIGSRK